MSYLRNFILQNKGYFESRLKEASNERIAVMGFYGGTVKETFEDLIEKIDENLLPNCFYAIFYGLGVSQDKEFTLFSFEEILPTIRTCINYPALSYIYAYCLNREGNLEKSEKILQHLSRHGFLPAIVTQGDLAWQNKDYKRSKQYYLKASNDGHYVAKTTLLRLFGAKKNIILRVIALLGMIKDAFKQKVTGEKYLYLNFYGLNRKKRIILT